MNVSRSGFTLIELVIIIVVVSIAIGALLTALASVTQNTIHPLIMQTATELAEQEVEKVTGTRFSFVCSCTNNAYAAPFDGYSRKITVAAVPNPPLATPDPTMQNYKMVDVTVTNSTIGSVMLRTIVTNRGGAPVACGAAVACA
ncbi:MAG: prepilin-type N-terminal cleavage/methylation domain-containing protein [Candidatus Omnitrophica bacterium]|nr:prepilin-type N-terminal cleavage/methylation domain-containing protein [Candidatus Omnitrophota bacterium]